MKNIYFFANQVYQYGHAKPIYDDAGGVFIVNKLNRAIRFKYYLRNTEKKSKGGFLQEGFIFQELAYQIHLR